jgi:RNA polymerase sigma-70 factor (sigma-E family)
LPGGLDDDAFARLYEEQYPRLFGAARLIAGDRATAEDVVQEVFVRVYVARRRIRPDAAGGYLYRAVVNECRNRSRARRVALRRVAPVGPPPAPADERAAAEDERARIAGVLAALPRRQRECLVLRYWLQLSEREIADALGISPGSVKTHVHRALASAAAELVEEHP